MSTNIIYVVHANVVVTLVVDVIKGDVEVDDLVADPTNISDFVACGHF